jgi:sporulation protein YlmC with PRC-barrel domain
MSEIQLREILGKAVVDSEGRHIGKLEEIEAGNGYEFCEIKSYIVEHRGILDRISSWALTPGLRKKLDGLSRPYRVPWEQMDLSDPAHPRTLVTKEALGKVE